MEALFLPQTSGRCFGVFRPGSAAVLSRGAILHVPAFAEEMNKSRRAVNLQSRVLAEQGWSVLQLDLFGCGDSEGDFSDATWERWVVDVGAAFEWLRERVGRRPVIWGMRAGCLLATTAAAAMNGSPDLLLWQPVVSGAQHLQQFLRLKSFAQVLDTGGGGRQTTESLLNSLRQGESVEVAGYLLSPGLAGGMEGATLSQPSRGGRTAWLEVASSTPPTLAPASVARIDAWRAKGTEIESCAVGGAPFWQTQEIAECPALIDATCAVLDRWAA